VQEEHSVYPYLDRLLSFTFHAVVSHDHIDTGPRERPRSVDRPLGNPTMYAAYCEVGR
jgi:hypothetical protein